MNVQNVSSGINGYYMPYETKQGKGGETEKTVCNNTAETDIASKEDKSNDITSDELVEMYNTMSATAKVSSDINTYKSLQKKLQALGFYTGSINGNLDSNASKKAIMNFQRVYGMKVTGQMYDSVKAKIKEAYSSYYSIITRSDLHNITSMVNGYSDFNETEIRYNIGKTWAFLRVGMGLTTKQSSGVLANIMAESGCVPDNLQDNGKKKLHDTDYKYSTTDGNGYGLLQWTFSSRKEGLKTVSAEMGLSVSDINAQFACIRKESEVGDCVTAWNKIKKNDSLEKTVAVFLDEIERPKEKDYEGRNEIANNIYKYLKNV